MNNFEFFNPVKIIFGKGEISKLPQQINNDAKVLLTYGGGSIHKNGIYEQVMNALAGYNVLEFGGIEPNPTFETLIKAVELVKKEKIDFLLAVGGGSVIDGTKFIAAAACYEGDPWDLLSKSFSTVVTDAIPLGTVLTLPATGSEMNGGAVITRKETKEKLAFGSPLLMPKFSILDPETIFSLPDKQIANGIVDAFIHVIEQYLTYPVNSPIQDRFSESILLTLIEEGPKVLADRTNYDAAANFMWSATMALNGLIAAGVPQDWSTHMIGHELTALHGIDHGRTLAIVLPGVWKVRKDSKKEKLIQYAERVWNIKGANDEDTIMKAIDATVAFFEKVGIKTRLSDYGVGMSTVKEICERMEARNYTHLGERRDIGAAEIEQILVDRL